MDEELSEILTEGQRIGIVPARHTEAFVDLVGRHFPDHKVGLLGEKQIELWVHPRLSSSEMDAWQQAYLEKRRELGLKVE